MTNLVSAFIQQEYLSIQLSEKMYRAKTYELMALQTQINPHFLFNTLETIHMCAFRLTDSANDVSYLIENLSGIMRYTLSDPNEKVLFKEEVSYTKSYLNIQTFRYKEKFRVIWEFDDDTDRIPVIRLLMQPLIENAIYHGIKEAPGSCQLKIRAFKRNHYFYLSIVDSGIGISRENLNELRRSISEDSSPYEHIGLSNTWKRLKLTYGDSALLIIRSKLSMGTIITLKFPLTEES
jgi:two-component system sensor histidine kinase YesM